MFVSISDEKPLHMRRCIFLSSCRRIKVSISDEKPLHMRRPVLTSTMPGGAPFQSQMRSRSTCDTNATTAGGNKQVVSISDEKPLHMRLGDTVPLPEKACGFNLR